MPALWIDIDSAPDERQRDYDRLCAFDPAPSFIVDSGGGWHAYWLLDEPLALQNDADRQNVASLLRGLFASLGGDPGYVKSVASVMRLPDSINTKGFSRTFNMYLMFDFPFKTNPQFSVALGAGLGTDNIFFDKMEVDVAGQTQTLRFRDVSDTNNYKKYKVATTYLEAPVELRFTANPANYNKSFKVAVGAKIGALLNVHNKGKNLLNSAGGTINSFTKKESSKRYFNGNRLAVTGRIGYGSFSLFGSYQVNTFIKEGAGPEVKPFTIGLTISGL